MRRHGSNEVTKAQQEADAALADGLEDLAEAIRGGSVMVRTAADWQRVEAAALAGWHHAAEERRRRLAREARSARFRERR